VIGKRAALQVDGSVKIEEYEVPKPGPDQVLVRISVTQVSAGSEVNSIRQRRGGPKGNFPQAGMGYTALGKVMEVGSEVSEWKVGDRVLCGGNHGTHWLVTPRLAHSPEAVSQQFMLERLPDDLDDASAAFCVLGDIAIHGIRRAQIQIGESVAVHGLGVVGLLAVQLARISGAYPVIGLDMVPARLELAKELGASHVVHVGEQDAVAAIRALTKNPFPFRGALPGLPPDAGANVQIHATSYIGNYPTMLKAAADRGRIVLVGATAGQVTIESHELLRRELKVLGSYETGISEPHPYWPWSRPHNHHVIWDLIRRGALKVEPLISHLVDYREAPALYEQMSQGGEGWLGVMFRWDDA
jgi:threonine dehydrogenase-like Zn-dependent dehydrogenase